MLSLDLWTMSNWPMVHPEAEEERDRLAISHRPVPLPGYDLEGELISPGQCREMLVGSVARVTFTLKHWFIDSGRNENRSPLNSFVADVHSIRVLVTPVTSRMSSKKRKTSQRDPDDKMIYKKIGKV